MTAQIIQLTATEATWAPTLLACAKHPVLCTTAAVSQFVTNALFSKSVDCHKEPVIRFENGTQFLHDLALYKAAIY